MSDDLSSSPLIIGGGIAGLALAIALRRHGHDPYLFERAAEIRPVGAGLTLWPNAIHALAELGLAEQVIEQGAIIRRGAIKDSRGRTLSAFDGDDLSAHLGQPIVAIHRADLHRILLSALPAAGLHLNHALDHLEQDALSVTAYFSGDRSVRGRWLVGADGIWSTVREQLGPAARPRYAGYVAWRGVVDDFAQRLAGATSESWGCGARFGIVPINQRQVYWFATANEPEATAGQPYDGAAEKARLLAQFRGWHDPVAALIEATPARNILKNAIYDLRPFQPWSAGRAILVGDAAHATTPNMGQGACQALESALVLARVLDQEPDPRSLSAAYEQERYRRTTWIMTSSRQIGQVAQWQSRPLCALRNLVLRGTPDRIARQRLITASGG